MLLSISGTKQGEEVHIVATEGEDKPFVRMKSSSFKGRIVEIVHKEKEYQGDKVDTFNLRFEARGQSHYFMMKSGSLALSVVNSLLGATTAQLEDTEISFYVDKESGFNKVSVRAFNGNYIDKPNGDQVKQYERLDWAITMEEKTKLTREFVGKGGKKEYDLSEYIKALIAKIPEGNAKMPARLVQGGSSDLFDEVMDYSKASPKSEVPATETTIASNQVDTTDDQDLPFV